MAALHPPFSAFPPTARLMFETCGFLVSSVFLLVGVGLVLRTDLAVGRWFRRLLHADASR